MDNDGSSRRLAALHLYAPTWGAALAIVARYYINRGEIHRVSATKGQVWECEACGQIVTTLHDSPPRHPCGTCEAKGRRVFAWVRMVCSAPPPGTAAPAEIQAQDFTLSLEGWIKSRWGRQAPPLMLCECYPAEDRSRCGYCLRCPAALRNAAKARARAEYEGDLTGSL